MNEPAFSIDLGSLSLVEVADAGALAGALFRNAFHSEIPGYPRHFVLLRRAPGAAPVTVGYVHYSREGPAWLAGGLIVAAMEFRRLDKPTADLVRSEGGMAEWIMRATCNYLGDAEAIFAYMGDAKSITVNTRVGFAFSGRKHLYVLWKDCPDPDRRNAVIERIAAIGPF
jgi:hypothetical protein